MAKKKQTVKKGVQPEGTAYEDDGNKYIVVGPDDKPVYLSNGVLKGRGEELVRQLQISAKLKKVEGDDEDE